MTITVSEFEPIGDEPGGTGCLTTERGNLPLHRIAVEAAITGLVARTELVQGFRNPHDIPLEATYIFPLPDRAAVTAMTLTAAGRTVVAELQERGAARQAYDDAIAAGRRAGIAEEDRPDVFTMRVGNIAPGEAVEVRLSMVGLLPFEDGEATYRLPLVVAPRYIPGHTLGGPQAGDGYAADTDSTPDASRITPPVLLPGFPNPIALSIEARIDAAGLPLRDVRSSLHAVTVGDVIRIRPGERADRDFILRLRFDDRAASSALTVVPDPDGDDGTFQFTVIPPRADAASRPKDVVLLLDRSGSMDGWKMVAARRAAARIVDSLTSVDRFAVLTYDNVVERPDGLPSGLVRAVDRHRYRAVEHLARVDARGGTELLAPLLEGLRLLAESDGTRERVLVLVTDGQVGNEDHILNRTSSLIGTVRVHTVGIDQAVNAGLLGRLATAGRGRCELVESEDRLDAAMDAIHRRIASPLVTGLDFADELERPELVTPQRLPDLFAGVPLVVSGRYRGTCPALELRGEAADGAEWSTRATCAPAADDAPRYVWARSLIRDLEDGYAVVPSDALERRIVETSLRFAVLSRFTAFVAVHEHIEASTGELHRVIQPVELPAGWEPTRRRSGPPVGVPVAGWKRQSARAFGASAVSLAAPISLAGRVESSQNQLQAFAADEFDVLRVAPADEAARRTALHDLAKRVEAMIKHLTGSGVDVAPLVAVLERLRDETVPTQERWDWVRRAVRDLADGPEHRREFWKRG